MTLQLPRPEAPAPPGVSATLYDAVPYSVNAFPQTTPNRLAVVASLLGMSPADPDRCRVLELGCASGGNLVPMAVIHPGSHFTGIDLSARQIKDGVAVVRELQRSNVDLRHMSIMDVTEDLGTFDYILAHGVYSWVPPEVQEKLLAVCARNLAPQGIAYVSYNTYPGWHARGALREMLWYHTEHLKDPAERIKEARAFLGFMAKSAPAQETAYSSLLLQELALLLRTPDTYLLHEHLEEFNEPVYFHQFAARAMEKGLQYLGESQIGAMVASRFGPEAEKVLRGISPDLLHMEQYMDFLRNRMFRQTLLCHGSIVLEQRLRPEAVMRFYISTPVKAVGEAPDSAAQDEVTFAEPPPTGRPKLSTHDPLMKAAMHVLGDAWPRAVRFGELVKEAQSLLAGPVSAEQRLALAVRMLNCHVSGIVEFSLTPSPFVTTVSDRPEASPYARLRARRGEAVTNLRLQTISLADSSRHALSYLDGAHSRASLVALMSAWLEAHPQSAGQDASHAAMTPQERAAAYIEKLLPLFAQSALLMA